MAAAASAPPAGGADAAIGALLREAGAADGGHDSGAIGALLREAGAAGDSGATERPRKRGRHAASGAATGALGAYLTAAGDAFNAARAAGGAEAAGSLLPACAALLAERLGVSVPVPDAPPPARFPRLAAAAAAAEIGGRLRTRAQATTARLLTQKAFGDIQPLTKARAGDLASRVVCLFTVSARADTLDRGRSAKQVTRSLGGCSRDTRTPRARWCVSA